MRTVEGEGGKKNKKKLSQRENREPIQHSPMGQCKKIGFNSANN